MNVHCPPIADVFCIPISMAVNAEIDVKLAVNADNDVKIHDDPWSHVSMDSHGPTRRADFNTLNCDNAAEDAEVVKSDENAQRVVTYEDSQSRATVTSHRANHRVKKTGPITTDNIHFEYQPSRRTIYNLMEIPGWTDHQPLLLFIRRFFDRNHNPMNSGVPWRLLKNIGLKLDSRKSI